MVEVLAQRAIGFRQRAGDACGQVAVRNALQCRAEGIADELALVGENLCLHRLLLGDVGRIHVNRYGQVHVEEDRLDEAAEPGGKLLRLDFLTAEQALLRPERANRLRQQVLDDQRIAADIPARLKPDTRVNVTDRRHFCGVVADEVTRGDIGPVPELRVLRAVHMGVVRKEMVHFRAVAHDGIELVQRRAELLLDEGLQAAQPFQRGRIQTEIVEATGNIVIRSGSGR